MATRLPIHVAVDKLTADLTDRGWQVSDLARKARVSDMTIYRILDGHITTAPTLMKIARALGKSIRRYVVRSADAASPEPAEAVAS